MNIINTLKKQNEAGKNIVTPDGNVISEDGIKKAAMKNYLAGLKAGEITSDVSLDDYMKNNAEDYVSVQEIIDFIEGNE